MLLILLNKSACITFVDLEQEWQTYGMQGSFAATWAILDLSLVSGANSILAI